MLPKFSGAAGEVPCAFVELKPGQVVEAEALRLFCRDHLAHFKVPRHITFCDLPRTATGKIQKFLLRERFAVGGGPIPPPDLPADCRIGQLAVEGAVARIGGPDADFGRGET